MEGVQLVIAICDRKEYKRNGIFFATDSGTTFIKNMEKIKGLYESEYYE